MSVDRVTPLTERLFREEAGKLVAVLTRRLGVERLQLAEDVVQEALVRALRLWPYHGVPENPAAWLTLTAKNLALDALRREKSFEAKQGLVEIQSANWSGSGPDDFDLAEEEIEDSQLRLMFVCCHPTLLPSSQICLALKTLGGFSVEEIARSFLTNDAKISKRLTRAKQHLAQGDVSSDLPAGEDLNSRLESVLKTIYLMFNEGYKASDGNELIRRDLCNEAVRLCSLVLRNRNFERPEVHGLLSLMLFNVARFDARTDELGNLLTLEQQNRSLWDRGLITQGFWHLSRSATGSRVNLYQLQAGIAALHCAAPTYEETNWGQILKLYDSIAEVDASPVVQLNRAIALQKAEGWEAAMPIVKQLASDPTMADYHLTHAVLADLQVEAGHVDAAVVSLKAAVSLARIPAERRLLERRLAAL